MQYVLNRRQYGMVNGKCQVLVIYVLRGNIGIKDQLHLSRLLILHQSLSVVSVRGRFNIVANILWCLYSCTKFCGPYCSIVLKDVFDLYIWTHCMQQITLFSFCRLSKSIFWSTHTQIKKNCIITKKLLKCILKMLFSDLLFHLFQLYFIKLNCGKFYRHHKKSCKHDNIMTIISLIVSIAKTLLIAWRWRCISVKHAA